MCARQGTALGTKAAELLTLAPRFKYEVPQGRHKMLLSCGIAVVTVAMATVLNALVAATPQQLEYIN